MSDENKQPYGDYEDTTRLPSAPSSDPAHTAWAPEHTSVIPPFFGNATEDPDSQTSRRRGRAATAGLLAAALLLGGAGGVAGAVGYDQLSDDTGAPGSAPLTSSSTLNTTTSDTAGSSGSSADASSAPEGSPEAVAAAVLPSVVKINVVGQTGAGSGSGVILTADGEILTNNHVVDVAANGGRITVNFDDGSTAEAEIVGTDPVTDLAVIKAEDVSGLVAARLGDSNDLDVGQGVVAIGSPFGLEATVTSGIVSSLNRPVSVPGEGAERTTYPAIQTDAAINPGNSGGPLVDLNGEVVGINSSIRSVASGLSGEAGSIGLGFAIPISKVLPVVEQLRAGETPTHALLGVEVATEQSDNGLRLGAGIQSVQPGSAADEAGLEPGDVVTKVDDETITSVESLVATIRGYRPGDTVTLTIDRDGETETLRATLDSDAESGDS
jgi:putative serine protease PepD